jgi:hypothetical protein
MLRCTRRTTHSYQHACLRSRRMRGRDTGRCIPVICYFLDALQRWYGRLQALNTWRIGIFVDDYSMRRNAWPYSYFVRNDLSARRLVRLMLDSGRVRYVPTHLANGHPCAAFDSAKSCRVSVEIASSISISHQRGGGESEQWAERNGVQIETLA